MKLDTVTSVSFQASEFLWDTFETDPISDCRHFQMIIETFKRIDTNNSGRLSRSEMFEAFCNPDGSDFTKETIVLLCGMFDSDESGGLDLKDFAHLFFFMEQWQALYHKYDQDQTGTLSVDDMIRALVDLGYTEINHGVVNNCVRRLGTETQIHMDAFIRVCSVCKRVTDNFRKRDRHGKGILKIGYNDFLKLALKSCF